MKGLRCEETQWFLDLEIAGTKDEEILRVLTGRREKVMSVLLCGAECTHQLTDELLVHADRFEEIDLACLPWMTNLKEVRPLIRGEDELAVLRREQAKMEAEKEEMDKKKERKADKRKKREGEAEGRVAKSPKRSAEELEPGQRPLEDVFKDTGMDPDLKRSARVLKKAKKVAKKSRKGKKKKERGSSSEASKTSSSSSTSSSLEVGDSALFEEEKKLRSVWKRCPGALSARSIQEIKKNLLTAAGTAWDMDKTTLGPVYTHYGRQVVMPGMGASLQQEVLTICQALDLMARGCIASSMDLLNQRLKSLEALGKGSHWSLCRQYELVKTEEGGMTEEQEKISAARQAREEERLRGLMSRPPSGKGGDYSQGKSRKGKDSKGSGKNQSGDAGKNRGGQGGKDDQKTPWQKK